MSGPANGHDSHLSSSSRGSARSSLALSNGANDGVPTTRAESSTTGSRRSGSSGGHENGQVPESVGNSGLDRQLLDNESTTVGGSWPRRHRQRHSGGFLLDSKVSPPSHGHREAKKAQQTDKDDKGKKRSDLTEMLVRKIRPGGHRGQRPKSIGSSPLATEPPATAGADNNPEAEIQHRPPSGEPFPSAHRHDRSGHEELVQTTPDRHDQSQSPSIGFDTDPVQIVNLALNLSESRRRNFASPRVVSGELGGRRVTSGSSDGRVARQGSLRQQLMMQRKVSRNISPISDRSKRTGTTLSRLAIPSNNREAPMAQDPTPSDVEVNDEEMELDVSDATLARVERAKQHFELLYEHRRLLDHLPPLRISATSTNPHLRQEGRPYNPLQYVRNRKVRFREKSPLSAEAEGWNDVEKVRAWVNAVAGDHTEPRDDPDQCIRLPQLEDKSPEPQSAEDDDASPSTPTRRAENVNTKPRRPRLDWVTTPSDLLADAYWMEQGLNKTKIEDRDGNKLYPWDTEFKFTGWRNRTPAHMQPPPLEIFDDKKSPATRENIPDLPVFRAQSREAPSDRGRRRHKLRDSIHSLHHSHSESRSRKTRWTKAIGRSQSTSSESVSPDDESFRGRSKKPQHERIEDHGISSAALEKQMLDMLDREAESQDVSPTFHLPFSQLPPEVSKPQPDDRRDSKASARSQVKAPSDNGKDKKRPNSLPRKQDVQMPSARSSIDYENKLHGVSEDDTTAPNSPVANGFVPSIAINLSPPGSRSPSPIKEHKLSRLNLFRPDRSRSKERHGISAGDFAAVESSNRKHSDADKSDASQHHDSRGASPMTKRMSLTPEDSPTDLRRTESIITKSSSKPSSGNEPHSRFRGMFKGGRIAELVGNEVSRVGDFIWKREAPASSRVSSTEPSVASDISDSEAEVPPTVVKDTPKSAAHLHRFPTTPESPSVSKKPSNNDMPKYFMSNLPTFTSPFKKDQESQAGKSPGSSPEDGPLSRHTPSQRGRTRDQRSDRLALPKIDVKPVSPVPSDETDLHRIGDDRRDSYGFGKALDLHRSRSAQDSSRRLNDALDRNVARGPPPPTGLAALDVTARRASSAQRPNLSEATRDFSLSSQSIRRSEEVTIRKRDIARARALLLSTGVKAREIVRRGNSVRDPPPPWLLNSCESPDDPVPRVYRKQEHLWAAKQLMRSLESTSNDFRDVLSSFSTSTAPTLHGRLQRLDDLISNTLTPRVRIAADAAGELGTRLTTSSTLAVKQLNDAIDIGMRRRRRRFRWLRRAGYVLLEWTLVGILWWVWLIVMIFKTVTGTVRGLIGVGRWLLWLD